MHFILCMRHVFFRTHPQLLHTTEFASRLEISAVIAPSRRSIWLSTSCCSLAEAPARCARRLQSRHCFSTILDAPSSDDNFFLQLTVNPAIKLNVYVGRLISLTGFQSPNSRNPDDASKRRQSSATQSRPMGARGAEVGAGAAVCSRRGMMRSAHSFLCSLEERTQRRYKCDSIGVRFGARTRKRRLP